MTALASIAAAAAIGCLLMWILRPADGLSPRWAQYMVQLALGPGAGVAVTSVLFLLLRLAGIANRGVILGVELTALVVLAAGAWLLRRRSASPSVVPAARGFRWNWLLGVAVGLALVLIAAMLANTASVSPYGNWEAFTTWNLDAKYLLAPGSSGSSVAVPSLLSAFLARTWLLSGGTSPMAPFAASMLFAAGAVALLFALLVLVRGLGSALVAVLVLVSATAFLEQIAWQHSDIPAGFYVLAAMGIMLLGRRDARTYGLTAAFGAVALWTVVPSLVSSGSPAPGAVTISAGILAAEAVSWGAGFSHPAVLIAILALTLRFDIRQKHRRFLVIAGLTVALVLTVEAALYLASPGELLWLLGTRAKGMYAQVWPTVVLLVFLALGKLEDPEPVEQPKVKKGRR